MNILVVDDKKSVRENLSKLLTSLGYTITTAVNGLDGFEKAQQASFQLYIIDHLMPLMDGAKLTKNLKKTPFCAQTPILFMTTQNRSSVESLFEFNLFNDVVTKPLNERLFTSKVASLIESVRSKILL